MPQSCGVIMGDGIQLVPDGSQMAPDGSKGSHKVPCSPRWFQLEVRDGSRWVHLVSVESRHNSTSVWTWPGCWCWLQRQHHHLRYCFRHHHHHDCRNGSSYGISWLQTAPDGFQWLSLVVSQNFKKFFCLGSRAGIIMKTSSCKFMTGFSAASIVQAPKH